MTPTDVAASTYAVDSRPRERHVQTSARMRPSLALTPVRPSVRSRFAAMLNPPPPLGENGLVDWSLDSALRRHVAEVLRYTEGDQEWAADELRVNRSTLYRWLRRWFSGVDARMPRKGRTS